MVRVQGKDSSCDDECVGLVDNTNTMDPVLQVVKELVQCHTEAMAVQARAVAVQNYQPITVFTGEGDQMADY